MRQILSKNQKKSKLYIYPKTNVITLLSLERSEALSSARLKILICHLRGILRLSSVQIPRRSNPKREIASLGSVVAIKEGG